MVEVLSRRLLEREHLASLRIDARHDVLDGAVLAGRIHRLKHEQQRPAVLGVEHVLLFREPLDAAGEQLGRLALAQLETAGVSRINALQTEALALGDAEWINVFLDTVEDSLVSPWRSSLSSKRNLTPTLPPREHRLLLTVRAAARRWRETAILRNPSLNVGGALDHVPCQSCEDTSADSLWSSAEFCFLVAAGSVSSPPASRHRGGLPTPGAPDRLPTIAEACDRPVR